MLNAHLADGFIDDVLIEGIEQSTTCPLRGERTHFFGATFTRCTAVNAISVEVKATKIAGKNTKIRRNRLIWSSVTSVGAMPKTMPVNE